MSDRQTIGKKGERMAAQFLEQKGYRVIDARVQTPFGEIDLVCQKVDKVIFVEVKTRTSSVYGYPEESVTPTKMKHIIQSAEWVLSQRNCLDRDWRIDVIAIELHQTPPCITHLEDLDVPEEIW